MDRIVRDAKNEATEPATVADPTMNHPLGNPYTNPDIVIVVEYPIKGGKADMNVSVHRIIHPPLISLHLFATGAKAPNILSLYIKKRTPNTLTPISAAMTSTFCIRESLLKVERTRRCKMSTVRKSCALNEVFAVREYGFRLFLLEEALRDHGGLLTCTSGDGEAIGDIGKESAFAVEL